MINRETKSLTLVYLVFLALLMVCGYFEGVIHTIVYILAFVLPFVMAAYIFKDRKIREIKRALLPSKQGFAFTAVSLFPTLLLVSAVSYSVTFVMFTLTGKSGAVDLGDSIPTALLNHALLPAVLEEGLFRLLPLWLIGRRAPRATVLFSALCFSLIHHSFFSIPYAFVAGAIFMALDLVCDSVLPSVIIHLVNNALTVILSICFSEREYVPYLFLILALASAVSFAAMFACRKRFLCHLRDTFYSGEQMLISYEPILLAVPTLFLAVAELI